MDRVTYIDKLKGFTIYTLVAAHVIQQNTPDYTHNYLCNIFGSFHMNLFFFLSGYIAHKTTKMNTIKDYSSFVQKKAMGLLIPFFVFPLFVEKLFFKSTVDSSFLTLGQNAINQLTNPSLWFLLTLFEIMLFFAVFYFLSEKFNKKKHMLLDLSLFLIIIASLGASFFFLNIQSITTFIMYFSFFFMGIFISKYELLRKIISNEYFVTIITLLFVCLVGRWSFSNLDLPINKILKIVISFLAIISFYNISKKMKFHPKIDNFLITMGKYSLVIYILHFYFTQIISAPISIELYEKMGRIPFILIITTISVFIMYFCVLIGKIVETMPVLNFLLFGKRLKNNK